MRIAFIYPPYSKNGRVPNLPQNRQFIYTKSNLIKIFPVVMAQGATWLKKLGHGVLWLDAITRRLDWGKYEKELSSYKPEMLILEAKTPVMKKLWNYVNKVKTDNKNLLVVLVGDHVSYFPEESLKRSKADYVLTGGDYDFLLVNLIKHLEKGTKLEPGIYYREKAKIVNSGSVQLNHKLDQVPIIDRELTCWRDYGEAYLYHPCAYVMFGRGCGIDKQRTGACSFCIWQHALWNCSARLVSPKKAIEEVKNLVNLGVKEIFDDAESGVLANYAWLASFYKLLRKEKLLGKIIFSSNARGDQLDKKTCRLLKKIGYRLLKVGLESGNDKTLKTINKKEKVEDIVKGVKNAKDADLRVMLTVMVGYPWEDKKDVQKTLGVTRELMLYKTRAGDCLQASVIIPYPGTPLWLQSKSNAWLKIKPLDYEKYDMDKSILKSEINSKDWCNKIWAIQKSPEFVVRSGLTIKSTDDFNLLVQGAKSLIGHLIDFS